MSPESTEIERRVTVKANDYCLSVRDGTHDSPKPVEHGLPLVTSRHLKSGQLDIDNSYMISPEDYTSINKRSKVDQWDVLISMIGTVGEILLVKEKPNFAIKNIGLFKTKSQNDGKWLYYYLNSAIAQNYLREHARGTTQQYVPLNTLRDMPILVPVDKSEMTRIAHILGTLDDKIENNRKTAKTLEAMAQAIFKSWFVDFDPVRAKMAGESRDSICKRLKLTPEILDLFPDRLVDSELGEIPEGWHNKAISEIVKRVSVGTKYDTKKVFEIGKVPVLDQGKSGIIGYHNGTPDIHASPTNPIIIFANHTCYMRLIPYDFSVIQNVLPFYGDGVDTIWAYFATRDKISFSEYKGHWPDFILEPVIVPSKALTTYFRTIISDLISAIFVADAMNEPISKTRDTLLPKLISGELRVSDPALLI